MTEAVFKIAAFRAKKQNEVDQLHIIVHLPAMNGLEAPPPAVLALKSPHIVKDIIEQLIGHRKLIWATAEPVNPDYELPTIEDRETQ